MADKLTKHIYEYIVKGFAQAEQASKRVEESFRRTGEEALRASGATGTLESNLKKLIGTASKTSAAVTAANERQKQSVERLAIAENNRKNAIISLSSAEKRRAEASDKLLQTIKKLGDKTQEEINENEKVIKASARVVDATNAVEKAQNNLASAQARVSTASRDVGIAFLGVTKALSDYEEEQIRLEEAARKQAEAELLQAANMRIAVAAAVAKAGAMVIAAAKTIALKTATLLANTALSLLAKTAQVAKNAILLLLKPLTDAAKRAREFWNRVGAVLTGVLIRDVIFGIIRAVKELASTTLDAAQSFQTLGIRLTTLISRQARLSGMTDNVAESFKIADAYAKDLLDRMTDMSATIPIDVETVLNTTAFGMAMGFSLQQAEKLSLSIANFTAAMGLGNEVAERIIYNFGQMRNAGKVTSTELRDLARGAFLPVNEIIKEVARSLGVAEDAFYSFKEEVAAGKIPVDEFFEAFNRFVESNFPEALERLKSTIEGVRIRLSNFLKTVVGIDVLGPLYRKVALSISNSLENLMQPAVRETAKLLGLGLVEAAEDAARGFTKVRDAIGKLLNAFGLAIPSGTGLVKIVLFIGKAFESAGNVISGVINNNILPFFTNLQKDMEEKGTSIAKNALSWGFNIAVNLAKGLIQGASRAITAAMNFISKLLSKWLKPGSPPLVAPELPIWGEKAMIEWLRGFTEADFGILDSVQDRLKSALDILADVGAIGEKAANELYISLSKKLIKSIDDLNTTGEITAQIFEELSRVGGAFGQELSRLLKKQVALAEAIEEAAAAQVRLNRAQEATKTARGNVNKLIREYNTLLRNGADRLTLENKLAQVNAAEMALQAAQEEEKAADAANQAAQEALKPAQQQVDLQERLIDQLLELAKVQADLAKQTGGGGEEQQPVYDIPVPQLPALDSVTSTIEDAFKNLRDEVDKEWAALVDIIKNKLKEIGAGDAFENIRASYEALATAVQQFWEEKIQPVFEDIKKWWEENGATITATALTVWEVIKESVGAFIETIGELFGIKDIETFLESLKKFALGVGLVIGTLALAITGIITGIIGAVSGLIDAIINGFNRFLWVGTIISKAWGRIKAAFTEGGLSIMERIGHFLGGVLEIVIGIMAAVGNVFVTVFEAIIKVVVGFIKGFFGFFKNLYDRLVGNSIIPEMMAKIKSAILGGLIAVRNFFRDKLREAYNWARNRFVDIWVAITTKIEEIRKAVADKIDEIVKYWQDKWQEIKDFVSAIWNDPDGIVQKVITAISDVVTAIEDDLGGAWTWLRDHVLDPMREKFDAVLTVIQNVVSWIGELVTAITNLDLGKIASLIGGLFGGGKPGERQSGGGVKKGSPYFVGEAGIELFVPGVSGYVMSSRKLLETLSRTMGVLSGRQATALPAMQRVSAPMVGGASYNIVIGPNSINNDMDLALFEARVKRVVTGSF